MASEHEGRCERLKALGETVAEIADILKEHTTDSASARRVLVAAGLMAGVYDVDEQWRIVERDGVLLRHVMPPPSRAGLEDVDRG